MEKGMLINPEFWMVALAIVFIIMVIVIGMGWFDKLWFGECWSETKHNLTHMKEGRNYFKLGDCVEKVVFTGKRIHELEENCRYTENPEGYNSLIVMYPEEEGGIWGLREAKKVGRWFTDTWGAFKESHRETTCLLKNEFNMEGKEDMVFDEQGVQYCVYLHRLSEESENAEISLCSGALPEAYQEGSGGGAGATRDFEIPDDYGERCWETVRGALEDLESGKTIYFGECVEEVIFSSDDRVDGHTCDIPGRDQYQSFVYMVPTLSARGEGRSTECIGKDFTLYGEEDVRFGGAKRDHCIEIEWIGDKTKISSC